MNDTIHIEFKLGWREIFAMLLEKLDMKELVNSEEQLYIHDGKVCRKDKETGEYEVLDYRADLFAALRNVANAMVPNLDFRSDPYITDWGDEYPSNYDVIKRMSPMELADFLGKFEDCRDDVFNWLISEAEEDDHD